VVGFAAASLGVARRRRRSGASWLVAAAALAGVAGGVAGAARLAAIDGGAFAGVPGARVSVRGFVAAVPRRANGEVSVRVDSASGRLLVTAPEPVPDLAVGREIRARGTVRVPRPWEEGYLARYGIARIVAADSLWPTSRRRGGIAYLTDRLRERAEKALGSGTPRAESALLRGFVLGEDDRIDPQTVDEFQRSGLAHLLAVSGQNVLLLALMAMPLLGLLGLPLRARLVCVLGLIAVYVPMAGAGPSIQRAGVMGAAAIVATLSSRPVSRWYSLLLAAAATLALNPRAIGDPGWQLSFAAVLGIALWAAPLRAALSPDDPGGAQRLRVAIAEGAAVTLAATVATAPLMAHHFERVSVAALPANLLAAPAVAPAMWLGMLAAAVGQFPGVPAEPLTFLAGLFAAYVEQVAHWLGSPDWAQVSVAVSGIAATGLLALLVVAGRLLSARAVSRRALRPRHAAPLLGAVALALALPLSPARPDGVTRPAAGLRVIVFDVGQGDAILLDPSPGDPLLVDTGPPEAGLAGLLADRGVDRLAAVVVTHDERDHSGGLPQVLEGRAVGHLGFAWPAPALLRQARSAAVGPVQLAEGSELSSGALRLDVLWPPRELLDRPRPSEANALSLAMLARWHGFRMLLTGDGEAEAVPLDPGPVDILKVAHHGSADAGLERLLDRSAPAVAMISVGADNPYGHPAPSTLAELRAHGVPTLRTDLDGELTLEAEGGGWGVQTGD
jgi:competence protein ComEC